MNRAAAALALAVCVTSSSVPTAENAHALQRAGREAYLMGTRARLAAYAADRRAGLTTLEAALEVLEATEAQLSTWRADSAISRFNQTSVGTPWQADPPLCRMLGALYEWHAATGGAFDPAIGALTAVWDIHGDGRIPSRQEVDSARRRAGLQQIAFDDRGCTLTRRANVTLDVGAFGKGEALDRVLAALGRAPWMIDFGGQVTVGGPKPDRQPWPVAIAHPLDRDRPYLEVGLTTGSLSTSGSSERDLLVDGERVGHILDPRTGRPARFAGSVTVWHERGLVADILSTALYVMGPEDGMAWADERGLSVCYLVPVEDGTVRVLATDAFRRLM